MVVVIFVIIIETLPTIENQFDLEIETIIKSKYFCL